jgi:hypothetical protein
MSTNPATKFEHFEGIKKAAAESVPILCYSISNPVSFSSRKGETPPVLQTILSQL